MSAEFPSPLPSRVRTDAAFARAIEQACQQRSWSRPTLAAQANVPLIAIHAMYRRAPVRPESVSAVCRCLDLPLPRFFDLASLLKLGLLLRDRRENAGLSRKDLGRLAKISDSTVKFIETGLHSPSRATCLRLLSVAALELTWSDLSPFAGEPPEPSSPALDPPLFRPDPRLSVEMIREQMLLLDHLRRHQYGLESSLTGWRRICWLCGARSFTSAVQTEAAQRLAIRHHGACTGQLAESLVHRYPILQELAQTERYSLLTLTARRLHRRLQHAEPGRSYGCRGPAALGEQLAYASAAPASLYHRGVAAVLLWALDLGACPLGLTVESFSEGTARDLLASLSESAIAHPAEFRHGVAETLAWVLEPHAPEPQPFCESDPPAHPDSTSCSTSSR